MGEKGVAAALLVMVPFSRSDNEYVFHQSFLSCVRTLIAKAVQVVL